MAPACGKLSTPTAEGVTHVARRGRKQPIGTFCALGGTRLLDSAVIQLEHHHVSEYNLNVKGATGQIGGEVRGGIIV